MQKMIEEIDLETIKVSAPYLVIKPRISEEEYFEITNEDSNCELFEGEIIMSSPASFNHEEVFRFLLSIISMYVEEKKLGKIIGSRFPIRLERGTLLEPDIVFISNDKLNLIKEKYFDGSPDLVMEILSPSTHIYDLRIKREKYKEHKINEIWFIDIINKKIIVDYYSFNKEWLTKEFKEGIVESKIIKGFYIKAEWLLQEKLPSSYEKLNEILKAEK
jgi:Uma2 family endonuclease